MKLKPRSVNRSSQAALWGAVAGCAVCLGSIQSGLAQTTSDADIRLVGFATSRREQPTTSFTAAQTNDTSAAEAKGLDLHDNIIKPACTTSADRWIKFENEYGCEQDSPSAIGRVFQACKYGLDRMTFTAQETAKRCEFTYDLGSESALDPANRPIAPQYGLPIFGKFGRAQFKSEVTIHDPQTGQAFIGLKLAIPFGQGG
jgi:hypothetical protein